MQAQNLPVAIDSGPPPAGSNVPPLQDGTAHLSHSVALSESLKQVQDQAAFVIHPVSAAQGELPRDSRLAASTHATAPAAAAPPPLQDPNDLVVPGLTERRLFVRLPETDPVQLLLERYVAPEHRPRRDLSGDYRGRTLDELIAAHNWRGVARLAYDQVTTSPPDHASRILSYWLLRFHALLRLHLLSALASELSAVTSLLPPAYHLSRPPSPERPPFHPAVPFELHLLSATMPSLQPDGEGAAQGLGKRASVERLTALVQAAKREMWRCRRLGNGLEETAWRDRIDRAASVLGGVLSDIRAYGAKRALIASATNPSEVLVTALARHHYSTGDLAALTGGLAPERAANLDHRVTRKTRVLELVGRAEWPEAEAELRRLVEEDEQDLEASVNLAVVLLYSAKLDEAISHLHALLSSESITRSMAAYHSPALLLNLCTLYELRSERAQEDKVRLLVAAAKAGGGCQGIEASAFKLAL